MKLQQFSEKQRKVLNWWRSGAYDALICDGAVRSGKTLAMSLSFVLWSFASFRGEAFALCGKTIVSLRRNVVTPLLPLLKEAGFTCEDHLSKNYLELRRGARCHRFYLFGGKDEGSAALIQGATFAGVLFDEVALMPRSFVEQALARCSVSGSKFWFNCNPEHPYHWFYQEWIQRAGEKKALHLHFTMEDNPSLTEEVRQRYRSLYSGRFYERFILGNWVQAQGLVYPDFSEERHLFDEPPAECERFYISCDYGTVNPTSMGLWGEYEGIWYRLAEYYYDARREQSMRTDEEHYQELCRLAGDRFVRAVIVDPSAASFIECIRRHGQFAVLPADNAVMDGIRRVSGALREGKLRFSRSCTDTLREFSLYCFDSEAREERPRKEYDHAMDDIRYFVNTILARESDEPGRFFATALRR